MPRISQNAAVEVLERFRVHGVRVFLYALGFGWSIGLEGRVSVATAEEVRIVLPGGQEAFALRLDMDDLEFWSGEPETLPEGLKRGIAGLERAPSFLGIVLPLRVTPEMLSGPVCNQQMLPRERIFLCEIGRGG